MRRLLFNGVFDRKKGDNYKYHTMENHVICFDYILFTIKIVISYNIEPQYLAFKSNVIVPLLRRSFKPLHHSWNIIEKYLVNFERLEYYIWWKRNCSGSWGIWWKIRKTYSPKLFVKWHFFLIVTLTLFHVCQCKTLRIYISSFVLVNSIKRTYILRLYLATTLNE